MYAATYGIEAAALPVGMRNGVKMGILGDYVCGAQRIII